jgi:hypothetical protein
MVVSKYIEPNTDINYINLLPCHSFMFEWAKYTFCCPKATVGADYILIDRYERTFYSVTKLTSKSISRDRNDDTILQRLCREFLDESIMDEKLCRTSQMGHIF